MQIDVNGKLAQVSDAALTYEQIVEMAGFSPGIYTVVYSTPPVGDLHRQGSVTPGKSVRIDPGMRFSVCDTSSA